MNRINIPRFTAEASLYRRGGGCLATRQAMQSSTRSKRSMGSVYPTMIDTGGVNCSNCVGGECAELPCFETWTHGGSSGPYEGGGAGPFGGGGGPSGGGRRNCAGPDGRVRRHGSIVTTTVVLPPGGPENTYVTRERCNNGAWVVSGF